MNLPNYFMADLPQGATLSPALISEASQTLRRNRSAYLATRSTQEIIGVLCALGTRWLETDYAFRKLALEQGPAATGFSAATLAAGLDCFFSQLTEENFAALLEQDLGDEQRLDGMYSDSAEHRSQRAATVTAPELLAHVAAGSLPAPALHSLVLGLLLRAAQFMKCASGASFIPRLFAHSLYEVEPKLCSCLEIAEWRGGSAELEHALFKEVDCVTATGSDEALARIRARIPRRVRFVAYGHRVSLVFLSRGVMSGTEARRLAAFAAEDVAAWDQLGCLSPHVIYVEHGGAVSPEMFAGCVADELARLELTRPRGTVTPHTAATIASRRSIYELRAAHSEETRLWTSKDSTAWTVVYEADPRFQLSCLHRFIYVKSAKNLDDALQGADEVRDSVSTVGLAAPEKQTVDLARHIARWGAARVCPLGRMQKPPLMWRHDGHPALAALVRWTDWEK